MEFYAPWCGHCKALAPEYDKAAARLSARGLKTKLMKVDATVETELAKKHEVTGYPSLWYFSGESPDQYTGGRTAATIFEWLRKREEGVFATIKEAGVEEFLSMATEGEFSIVARVKKGSVRDKAFKAAVNDSMLADYEVSQLHFAVVYLPKGADAKKDASLTMRRPGFSELGDEGELVMPGVWSEKTLGKWVLEKTYPTIAKKFSANKYGAVELEKIEAEAVAVAVTTGFEEDEPVQALALFKELAPKYPKWKFVVANQGSLEEGDTEVLGTAADDWITVLMGKKRYLLQNWTDGDSTDEAKVAAFFQEVAAKKAKPHYKSAALPESPIGEDNVLTLTGDTFEEVVLNPNKDVFVKFYAPSCGHCQKMAPEWSALGRKMKSEGFDKKGVVIAKMDGTQNECDEEITGFPKAVLYPAVDKKRKMSAKITYGGPRAMEPMVEFLLESARNLDGADLQEVKKESFDMAKRELAKKKKQKAKSEL